MHTYSRATLQAIIPIALPLVQRALRPRLLVTRRWRSQFDAQQITNLAVEERLQRDSDLEDLLSARLSAGVNPSISGSFARYLAAAGKLGPEARVRALNLLRAYGTNQRLPVAGYDAIADQWRAARATLLDAISAGLEIG